MPQGCFFVVSRCFYFLAWFITFEWGGIADCGHKHQSELRCLYSLQNAAYINLVVVWLHARKVAPRIYHVIFCATKVHAQKKRYVSFQIKMLFLKKDAFFQKRIRFFQKNIFLKKKKALFLHLVSSCKFLVSRV